MIERSHTKEADVRDIEGDRKVIHFFIYLRLKCSCRDINIKMILNRNLLHYSDTLTKINIKIYQCELTTFYWLQK